MCPTAGDPAERIAADAQTRGWAAAFGALRKAELHRARDADALVPLDLPSLAAVRDDPRTIVPDVVFGVEAYNRVAYQVYRALRRACEACAPLTPTGDGRYLNLAAIFFHDLQTHLSSFYFKAHEADALRRGRGGGPTAVLAGSELPGGVPYGCVWGQDRDCSGVGADHSWSPREAARVLAELVRRAPSLLRDGPTVAVSGNLAAPFEDVEAALRRRAPGLRLRRFVGRTRVHIPGMHEQLAALEAELKELAASLAVPPARADALHRALRRRIVSRTSDRPGGSPGDVVLTGSLSQLDARFMAARARAVGAPVVTVLHGEACGLLDEPVFGYGEVTFASRVVGYGDRGTARLFTSDQTSPLFPERPRVVPASAPRVRGLHASRAIRPLAELPEPRVMYVPTMFSGNLRYGPHRDAHDVAYLYWQVGLLKALRARYGNRVVWKRHPKDKVLLDAELEGVEVSREPFEEAHHTVDVFVLDYVSTALHIAAATAKPVMFLNLGLRHLLPDAVELLRSRCLYVDADLREPEAAVGAALAQSSQAKENAFTPFYSLAADPRPRTEIIADVVMEAVGGSPRGSP